MLASFALAGASFVDFGGNGGFGGAGLFVLLADRDFTGGLFVPEFPATGLLDGGTASRGYLLKERVSHFDQLSEAVHQVAAGGTVLDPLVVEALLAQPSSAATLSRLTPREREVLAELATGLSNRTVAQRLVLTQRAVEKHINSIFAKLGLTVNDSVDRRVKAVLMFLDDHGSAPGK